jgi:Lrp/AsnC family transcriptional regulator for asnA, asnC and gidA
MKIDEISVAILRHIKNGRKSFKAIAEDLSIAENTVRTRVNNMIEKGIVKISGLVDLESLPGHMVVIVGIRLKTMDGVGKCEEIGRLKGVVFASVVTGRYDLILVVSLNEKFGLTEFFKTQLDLIEDILSAETFVAYKSYNLYIPYIL